jgi:hypothetical protein
MPEELYKNKWPVGSLGSEVGVTGILLVPVAKMGWGVTENVAVGSGGKVANGFSDGDVSTGVPVANTAVMVAVSSLPSSTRAVVVGWLLVCDFKTQELRRIRRQNEIPLSNKLFVNLQLGNGLAIFSITFSTQGEWDERLGMLGDFTNRRTICKIVLL